jgi:hypothetical protein
MSSEERTVRLERAHKKITLLSALAGYMITWLVASMYLAGPVFWLTLTLGGAGLTWLIYLVTFSISTYSIYRGNLDELGLNREQEDVAANGPMLINLEIAGHPDEPVGRYMDHEFYEWLDFKSKDGTVRAHFFGTVDLKREVFIPPGCVLLSPGLLYEIESSQDQDEAS